MTPHEVLAVIIAGAAAWWLWNLWVHPFRPCPRCAGKGVNRGSNKRWHGTCRRCRGSKHVQRLGSRQLHKAILAGRGAQRARAKKNR